MSDRYKPILPAPTAPRATLSPGPSSSVTLPQRRTAVRVACNGCRSKRSACDGIRPACSQCLKRQTPCIYVSASAAETPSMVLKRRMDDLKKSHDSLAETIHILKTAPEDTSLHLLRTLRSVSTKDPAEVLSLVKDIHVPDDAPPRQVLSRPPPQRGIEFNLILRHAVAYPALVPLDAGAVSTTTFTVPISPGALAEEDGPASSSSSQSAPSRPSPAHGTPQAASPHPILRPSLPPELGEYCDKRLEQLQIGFWIATSIPNSVAASLISLYLRTDHPVLGLFDVDLFLDDLVAHRTRFCSPLLVSSILVWAYHAYRTVAPVGEPLMDELLLSEALALWKFDHMQDSLPTLAAATLLSLNSVYDGAPTGLPYFAVGIDMAQRMGLFGQSRTRCPPWPATNHETPMDEDEWVQASAHVAWGVYSFLAMHSFMFHLYHPALHSPPLLDVPGGFSERQADESQTDGDVAPRFPDFMGRTFPAICRFWHTTSEWMAEYYAIAHVPVVGRLPMSFAEKVFDKLMDMFDEMNFALARGDHCPHHAHILHILLHVSVVELFRPFATEAPAHVDPAFEHDVDKAQAIMQASANQLKHLVIVFRYTFSCARYMVFWHLGLLHVANAALADISKPQWRVFFDFALRCYAYLSPAFPLVEEIVCGLMSMGLRDHAISTTEAQSFLGRIHSRKSHDNRSSPCSSAIIVDLKLAVSDRHGAQARSLADMFAFYEFIDPEVHAEEGHQPVEDSGLQQGT